MRDADSPGGQEPPTLSIPEIRDYQKINAELVALLEQGHPLIHLDGAEGQRLLAFGLSGPWRATIEIVGRTGPELAAELNAPNLVIVARGPTADGVARGLTAGRVMVLGAAAEGAGYGQSGGILVIAGSTGHRAGLRQSGGVLALLASVGRLAGDCQRGGHLFARSDLTGPHPGRGRRGGRFLDPRDSISFAAEDAQAWASVVEFTADWLDEPRKIGP